MTKRGILMKLKSISVGLLSISLLLGGCTTKPNGGKYEQQLRMIAPSDIPTMDSSLATDAVASDVFNQTIEGLYTLDKNDKPIPAIATGKPKIENNGTKWTVNLRKNAKWSNGENVTAHDFEYAWKRTIDPKTGAEMAYLMYDLKNAEKINTGKMSPDKLGVKALDDYTLQFEINKPLPYYQELLTTSLFLPQNEKFVKKQGEKYGTSKDTTLYNGPFTLSTWDTESRFELSPNKYYWDKDKVKLKSVTYTVQKDQQTAINLYLTGSVDRVVLPPEFVEKYKQDKRYKTEAEATLFFIRFNQKKVEAFKNKNMRMALAKSIDREVYVKNNLNNGSKPAIKFMPTDFIKDENGKDYSDGVKSNLAYDKKEARAFYEKAKKELGKDKFTFEFLTFDQESSKRDAEFFKEQIESTLPGVNIKIKIQPFKQKLDLESKMQYDLSFAGWGPDYPDPLTFLEIFQKESSQNQTGWSNDKYEKAIVDAKGPLLTDVKKRTKTLQEAETLLLDEAVIIPIYQRGIARLIDRDVKGFIDHKFGGDTTLKEVYIEK